MNTTPYSWPWDHAPGSRLTSDRLAVVVCGWQRHWLDGLAPSATGDGVSVSDVRAIVDAFRDAGAFVMWVRTGAPIAPSRRPPTLPVVGSAPWELLAGPQPLDVVVDTPGVDAFLVESTDLELRLRGCDRLVMCGIGTEGPVSSTTRSANDRGYECLTATDAVLHHDAVLGAASLSSVCMSGGIFGAVGSAADVLSDLTP